MVMYLANGLHYLMNMMDLGGWGRESAFTSCIAMRSEFHHSSVDVSLFLSLSRIALFTFSFFPGRPQVTPMADWNSLLANAILIHNQSGN